MKLSNKYKTVLFYGHILRVKNDASYLVADATGEIFSYTSRPAYKDGGLHWRGEGSSRLCTWVTFESGENWKDTLTYCEGEGQEWMLDLKTKIAVEYALLQDGSILREKALYEVVGASPFGEPLTQLQWEAFRKHSGVENVAGKKFLDALEEKIKSATTRYIGVEKATQLEDDSRLVRDYYGAELVIPEWAQFISMDSDGRVWCYELLPEPSKGSQLGNWTTGGRGKACVVGWRSKHTAEKEWRGSLREVRQ